VTISNQPSIYGRVTLSNNNPLSGVTLNLTGAQTASRQTDNQGFYQFANLQSGGDYAVTPSLDNFSFEPASRGFNTLNADQEANFVAARCSYSLTPANQSFDAAGGTGAIMVTAPPRCPWTATPSASWIKITSGASGAGNGSVTFSVDPTTAPRGGHITIADQNFAIWQGVNVCNDLKFRPRSYFGFGFPNGLFADDVDGDGLTDLFVMQQEVEFDQAQQRFAFPLTIYYGEANGRLTPGPRIFAASVTQPRAIAVGDFNGDGRRDLAVAPGNEPDARLLLNAGARAFTPAGSVRISPLNTFDYPGGLRAADLNKDGKLDLIGESGTKVLIALNTSTGANVSFAPAFAVSFEGQNFRGLSDFNNDGVVDLLTVGGFAGGPRVVVYLGDGLGSFRQPISSPATNFPLETDFADFNGDGAPDIAMTAQTPTPQGNRLQVALLYGDGAGRFGQLATYGPLLINPIGQSVKLIVRDVNNDARPDALVLGERKVRAVLTDPAGKPGSLVEVGSTDNFDLSAFAVGNFDAGGRPDFATIDGQRNSVVVHWNRCGISGLTIYGQALDRTTPVGFGGVTVKLTGARNDTVTTDVGGNYEFTGLAPGNYTVAVERGATEFNPSSQTLNNLMA
ncbi:MAG: FG-GAP-like repeat-containing protein, partial [Blastocatellia bacterium]